MWSREIVRLLCEPGSGLEKARAVALFAGLKSEPDLLPLLPWLAGHGVKAVFFLIKDEGTLEPRRVRMSEDLVIAALGALEPDRGRCERIDLAEIDVVLVPALAFSVDDGMRLGRGKGYYDRLLSDPGLSAATIGVGFEAQMVPHVPHEAHDLPVQRLLSQNGWREIISS